MSAPLAGKFQDHYALLGVDPRCNADALQSAFSRLTQKYHPDNKDTGDHDKFEAISLAFEVLSDPMLRAAFDQVKGIDQDDSNLMFAGMDFFDSLGRQSGLRAALLCVLYDRRRKKPTKPSLSIRQVENIVQTTNDELVFALFYLKSRNLVVADDKSNLQITVEGMDFLEQNHPAPEKVLPFIKPAALFGPTMPAAAAPVPAVSVPAASVPPAPVPAASVQTAPVPVAIASATAGFPVREAIAPSVLPLSVPASVSVSAPAPAPEADDAESVLTVLTRALARR
jgi:hypothetical protein